MPEKFFILDTNVLLHNSRAIFSFSDNTVVLPMTVIEELDKFKKNNDELGRNSRDVIRTLDRLREKGCLGTGVPLDSNGTLRITVEKEEMSDTCLNLTIPDNNIIATAYNLRQKGKKAIFVSKDINARLKADALGIEVMDFEQEKADFDQLYTGWQQITVPAEAINELYKNGRQTVDTEGLQANEFVLLTDEANPKHTGIGRAISSFELVPINSAYESVYHLKPRSMEQRMALDLLMNPDIPLVSLIGQAGTGKTLLALAAGLASTLQENSYEKMLVSRPVIPLGRDIGYLPGSKDEKMKLWMQPIFDNLSYLMGLTHHDDDSKTSQQMVNGLIQHEMIELEALTYIRGRSISRQYVIIDEAQNLTPHEVKTIISRAGEGTKMVLTGDPEQIDNPYLDASSNGLTYTIERLKGQSACGHITLTRAERSHLSALAADFL